jgi:phosphatidylinositol-3-phosphatase
MKHRDAMVCAALGSLFIAGCGSGSWTAPTATTRAATSAFVGGPKATGPHASFVVVVIMANRDYGLVVGSTQAPFINGTLVPQAALMTDSHAIAHPSQPNYLGLFSGSTQGITNNSCPHAFDAPNLGAEAIAAGWTFVGYSESMPKDGYTGCLARPYARKHNPWVDFASVPASSNLIWFDLPGASSMASSLSIIVPNLCNDMEGCNTQTGDNWLKANLPSILQYDAANNGLLILTWDEAEPDTSGTNQIATMLLGPMIVPGKYAQNVDHYAVLHTIETIVGVACTAKACKAPVLTGMWQ